MRTAIKMTVVAAAILLSGCTHKYEELPPEQQQARFHDFMTGRIILDCQVSCAGAFGYHRRELASFNTTQNWRALADNVMKIGFNQDLSWYYLGRAAEGLNYLSAARVYYAKALSGAPACDSLFDACDGFKFPDEAQKRLDILDRMHG